MVAAVTGVVLVVVEALPSWQKSPRPQQRWVPCVIVTHVW
jgi:hypothetical protein